LCSFANLLTINPEVYQNEKYLAPVKRIGITDSGILDATLVVAYFNFVNRIVLALGLEVSEAEMKGYRY
jgi:alkylhydroperoxidase family enzyme